MLGHLTINSISLSSAAVGDASYSSVFVRFAMFFTLLIPLSNIFHVMNEVALALKCDPNTIIMSSWWSEYHRNLQTVSALYLLPAHQDCTVSHHQCVVVLESQKAQKSRAIALDFSAFWLSRLGHNNQRRRDSNHPESHTFNQYYSIVHVQFDSDIPNGNSLILSKSLTILPRTLLI